MPRLLLKKGGIEFEQVIKWILLVLALIILSIFLIGLNISENIAEAISGFRSYIR